MQELELTSVKRTPNRRIDKDTVATLMSEIIENIADELNKQKELNNYSNLKFYKELLHKIKILEHDVLKLLKQKKPVSRKKGVSIFKKPVPISKDLSKFLNVPMDHQISRAECTKALHVYIVNHKLQNPQNKKEIIPDDKLSKLLNYNQAPICEGGDGPLYYTTIQKLIQKHFVKQE